MASYVRPAVWTGRGGGRPYAACAAALAVAVFAAGAAQAQYGDVSLPDDCYEYADVDACLDYYCTSYWDTYGHASYPACLADPFAHTLAREAPTDDRSNVDSGTVAFDSDRYGIGDIVTVTIYDPNLNVDPGKIDSYRIDPRTGFVGDRGSIILDITLDGQPWSTVHADPLCLMVLGHTAGLDAAEFSLTESGRDTGVFTGSFQVPQEWCRPGAKYPEASANIGLEANYFGGAAPAGARAAVEANSGSVSLDRAVYPVPFGVPLDFEELDNLVTEEEAARDALDRLEALYALQSEIDTAMDGLLTPQEFAHTLEGNLRSLFADIRNGGGWNDILDNLDHAIDDAEDDAYYMRDLNHIVVDRVRAQHDLAAKQEGADPHGESYFPIHSTGFGPGLDGDAFIPGGDLTIHVRVTDPDYDTSATQRDAISEDDGGPVTIWILREYYAYLLGRVGGTNSPMLEIAPDAGVFEIDVPVRYNDGPTDQRCPVRGDGCILQGDVIQVEYVDPVDAYGDRNAVTDTAAFGLRTAVLLSDKTAYRTGDDMILTLIEPDLDLDGEQAESYTLDLIEWDSDAATLTMGSRGGQISAFDPEPGALTETGESTGIFQAVVRIPEELEDKMLLENGEAVTLEYTDWGPAGAHYVGHEDEDAVLRIRTTDQTDTGMAADHTIPWAPPFGSGATMQLDQRVYTWTDRVYITITAPDQNRYDDLFDKIGNGDTDSIRISTRGHDLREYTLVETGTDTGIFAGAVTLTGFLHDADGDHAPDAPAYTGGSGPTSGLLEATGHDVLTVSYDDGDHTVTASALIRWSAGEVQWLRSSYPGNGAGVVRVIDPDMNLNPDASDILGVRVWSDSDQEGMMVLAVETGEATGVFEGVAAFQTGSGLSDRLAVGNGDTVTAEYVDLTIPYEASGHLVVAATTTVYAVP